ncbi:MAG: CAP domain-containing protein [Candidatus Nealsonbacteria bacterium]|nr:CAP domain-containing protein [Candidatus Nealsonbacteria bacterium]
MKNRIKKVIVFILPCEDNNYRPLFLDGRLFDYLALSIIILKFIGLLYFVALPGTPFFSSITRNALVQMTNEERRSFGLPPLITSPKLDQAAMMKAQDMIAKDYFSHWSPDGKSPWHWITLAGYDYKYAGENLAMGFLDAKDVHRAWVNSSTHKANIMSSNYDEIGIAVVEGIITGQRTFIVVQVFGKMNQKPAPIAVIPPTEEIIKDVPIEIEDDIIISEEEIVAADEDNKESEQLILGYFDSGIYFSSGGTIQGAKMGLFEFLMLEYDGVVQRIILISLLFLIFILIVNIFIRFDVQHPDLIFKGLFFLGLFLLFNYLDQVTLLRLISGAPLIG